MLAFKLFLKRKRVSSCSQSEIGKISITEDKANAHAGMPFSGISRFAVPAFLAGLCRFAVRCIKDEIEIMED